ncbi:hypothetical protein [Flavobacterium sp.]|uniref:hypothetical protein n=1 Tax=Flavobacterium sp. TaxID=239 RepID=UPI0037BE6B35
MKKILVLSFMCFSLASFAQQKPKSKTNVPVIKEAPKTNVPVLTDADELLDVKSNEPDSNDLLDVKVSIPKPKLPNAGQSVYNEIGLNGNFSFNKKVGFSVNAPEGNFVSYFYLNTKNGYAMLDWKGIQEMLPENPEGEMTQIKSANNDFYQYIKSSEGNFAMKMGSDQSMVVHDLQTGMSSKHFFKTFKKTGNKVGRVGGNKYPRVEYSGTFEGKKMAIWLSDSQEILIDTKFTYSISGYWGLGFMASPSGKTYMITGITGDGVSIFMNYIENANANFSGKGYKPIGDMLAPAMENNAASEAEMYSEMQTEINNETDPKLQALKVEALKKAKKREKEIKTQAEKFAQSSDLTEMPYVSQVHNSKATSDYYDMMILVIDQSIREHELGLKEAQEYNDAKSSKRYTCLINCTSNEKNRLEKVKSQHLKILAQFKEDEDLRDEKINQLMASDGIPKACNCE